MSNRIAVFNDGKVQQLSTPDKLYEEPVNSFVAEFIGENNTFAGEVTDISGGKCKVKLDTGGEIISNPIGVKSKGEKTKVSLRPERAIIDPEEKMDNKHKGKIEEIIYHGDHARVRLNLLGNKEFILKVPNSSARMDIKRGNEINVGWNSHDARALDQNQSEIDLIKKVNLVNNITKSEVDLIFVNCCNNALKTFKRRGIKMRKLSKLLLTLVFALSISSTSYAVTVASWGGAYTESQKLGYGDPTAKKLGIPINWVDYSGGLSEIKAQKAAGKITWDIIDVFAMDTINGCDEGLFVKFDFDKDFPPAPDGTKASKDFFTSMPSKCAVGNILYSWTYAYNDKTAWGGKTKNNKRFL